MSVFASLGLQREDNAFTTAVIDPAGTFGYFATISGNIIKIRLSDFSPVANLTLLRKEKRVHLRGDRPQWRLCLLWDRGFAGKNCPFVAPYVFRSLASSLLNAGESNLQAGYMDAANDILYFVSAQAPAKLITIQPSSFKRKGVIPLPFTNQTPSCTAMDIPRKTLYFAVDDQPAKINQIRIDVHSP